MAYSLICLKKRAPHLPEVKRSPAWTYPRTLQYVNGKVYDELEELTGLRRETIRKYRQVADATSGNRLPDLTYSHHQEVASLPVEDQKELLMQGGPRRQALHFHLIMIHRPQAITAALNDAKVMEERPAILQESMTPDHSHLTGFLDSDNSVQWKDFVPCHEGRI